MLTRRCTVSSRTASTAAASIKCARILRSCAVCRTCFFRGAVRFAGRCRGRPQKELTREQRLQNARGAFGCRPGTDLTGRRVLLIDDIITTGATASACALALLEAGAVEVTAVAIAAAEELPKSRKKPPETKP